LRVSTVVGNRPQFVKAAAVSRHLRTLVDETLIDSGQHYDHELSQVFFEELGLPPADHELAIGSGSHSEQTAALMLRLEPLLRDAPPDAVLVYGDTNTTLAAALVAAKLQIPLVHVESGMRSFDRSMPEEQNRIATDHLSDLLLCPTEAAMANLAAEGRAEVALLVGDVMADVALEFGPIAERRSDVLERLGLEEGRFVLATLHRQANVDDPSTLKRAVEAIAAAADSVGALVWPLHPRTRARLEAGGQLAAVEGLAGVRVTEPLGYLDFTCLLRGSRAVLTDSGGVQKEAVLAGVPCLTMRTETEWVETVESGGNRLVGVSPEAVLDALEHLAEMGGEGDRLEAAYGGGGAGRRSAEAIAEWLASSAA
jgi:UDP-GlcNAc3NAcA epimerase